MKRVLVVLAGAILAASMPSAAWSQQTKEAKGTVTVVGRNSVSVNVNGKDMSFTVDGKTEITAEGASTATRAAQTAGKAGPTLDEIVKIGQGVEIRYHEPGRRAASLRVLPGAPSTGGKGNKSVQGVVTAVYGSALSVKGRDGEWTFVVDAKTVFTGTGFGTKTAAKKRAGEAPVMADFVGMGDTVTVEFAEAEVSKHASRVRVTRKADR